MALVARSSVLRRTRDARRLDAKLRIGTPLMQPKRRPSTSRQDSACLLAEAALCQGGVRGGQS